KETPSAVPCSVISIRSHCRAARAGGAGVTLRVLRLALGDGGARAGKVPPTGGPSAHASLAARAPAACRTRAPQPPHLHCHPDALNAPNSPFMTVEKRAFHARL